MFAPNGQQYEINTHSSVTSVGVHKLLTDSFEDLEYSASFNRAVRFELSDDELLILQEYYPEVSNKIVLFRHLIGFLLEYYEFMHRLKAVYTVAGTNRFYCVFRLADETDLDF